MKIHNSLIRFSSLLFCIFLSSCCLQHSAEQTGTSSHLINTDRTNLKHSLDQARKLSLETGLGTTIRMQSHSEAEKVRSDQDYARKVIDDNYEVDAIISFEPVS